MINDPYKVLGVEPGASKKEIKAAYNKMVKKYHPDYYKEKHMKELAEQKMKEINEAYDYLLDNHQHYTKDTGNSKAANEGHRENGGYTDFNHIRRLIQAGRFAEARQLLMQAKIRNAEWSYLMGVVEISHGNYTEGRRLLEQAVRLDPANEEYQKAYQQTMGGTFFSRRAGHARTDAETCCQVCTTLWCLDCCCECSGGDFISCC